MCVKQGILQAILYELATVRLVLGWDTTPEFLFKIAFAGRGEGPKYSNDKHLGLKINQPRALQSPQNMVQYTHGKRDNETTTLRGLR